MNWKPIVGEIQTDYKEITLELFSKDGKQGDDCCSFAAKITLCRPQKGNSISPLMAKEIVDAVGKAESHRQVRAIILTGTGKFFCTGMDLSSTMKEKSNNNAESQLRIFSSFRESSLPTICILNGHAMGGGVGLFFSCDIQISTSPSNYIFLPEVQRGIIPALISPYIVECLPKSLLLPLLCGEKIDAQRLCQIGSISGLLGDDSPSMIDNYLDLISNCGPNSLSKAKFLFSRLSRGFDNEMERKKNIMKVFSEMLDIDKNKELQVGMQSFFSKEKPNWLARL